MASYTTRPTSQGIMAHATVSPKSPDNSRFRSSKEKPNITVDNLRAHGIEYDPELINVSVGTRNLGGGIPESIGGVREFLLDFSALSVPRAREEFMKHELSEAKDKWNHADLQDRLCWSLEPPSPALCNPQFPDDDDFAREKTVNRNIEVCRNIAAEAAREHRKSSEARWTGYLSNNIFSSFRSNTKSSSEYDLMFKRWYLEQDVYWSNHTRLPTTAGQQLTGPKPDLTYAFPIFTSHDNLPKGLSDMEDARNFSIAAMQRYNNSPWNLKASLTKKIYQEEHVDLRTSDLMCFPWAVVEVKCHSTDDRAKDFCYRQAANASATALDIMTALFKESAHSNPDNLPPIIAFTCTGPELRLWLMYWTKVDGRKIKKMVCIWATHLELTWGVLAARSVVSQMTRWAMRILKPKICNRLTFLRCDQNSCTASPVPGLAERIPPVDIVRELSLLQTNCSETPFRCSLPIRGIPSKTPKASQTSRPSSSQKTPSRSLIPPEELPEIVLPSDRSRPAMDSTHQTQQVPVSKQTHDRPMAALPGKSSKHHAPDYKSSSTVKATCEDGQHYFSPNSETLHGSETHDWGKLGMTKLPWELTASLKSDQKWHEKPGPLENMPGVSGRKFAPEQATAQSSNSASPALYVDGGGTDSSCRDDERPPGNPEGQSPLRLLGGRRRFADPNLRPYHIYRIRRKAMLTFTTSQDWRLETKSNDEDDSDCSDDTSSSEYLPSNPCNFETDSEDESEYVDTEGSVYFGNNSDSAYSPSNSWTTEREGDSDEQSDSAPDSDWKSEANTESAGSQSSEFRHQLRDEMSEGSQTQSDCGSSEFWDSEVDCDPLPDAFQDDFDNECSSENITHSHHGGDYSAASTTSDDEYRSPVRGYLIKEVDIKSLSGMLLSTLSGEQLLKLPLMRMIVEFAVHRLGREWVLALWSHDKFAPEQCDDRDALVRDINTCLGMKKDDKEPIRCLATAELTFDALRRSHIEEALELLSDRGDKELLRRICLKMIILTQAPHFEAVLRYVGLEEHYDLWTALGEEALRHADSTLWPESWACPSMHF